MIKELVPVPVVGEVVSVNKDTYTCVVKVTGTEETLNDVRLLSVEDEIEKPTVLFPKVGSYIGVLPLFGSRNDWAMFSLSEIDEMLINGVEYGGMVKANILKQELAKTNQVVSALADALLNFVPVPGDGGAALKSFAATALAGKTVGDFSGIENTLIKHG